MNIYIPEDLDRRLDFAAQSQRIAKAECIRQALQRGLAAMQAPFKPAQTLLQFAKMAERIPTKGTVPKDFIKNLDYYTWGGKKREQSDCRC